jgi:hypothetical protein
LGQCDRLGIHHDASISCGWINVVMVGQPGPRNQPDTWEYRSC